MIKKQQDPLSEQGSVLMEFVLVLPIYIMVLGGILWIGMRSLDATGLRTADRWGVWEAGNRFEARVIAATALQKVFPRTILISTSTKRALANEHSFLQLIGGNASVKSTIPDFIENWLDMGKNVYGYEGSSSLLPDFMMSSSRYGNKYTQFIVMRTKSSGKSKRHWHPSIIADQKLWDFDDKKSGDVFPKEWKKELLDKAKHTDDTKEVKDKEPKKIEFYERYSWFEKWSKK